MCVHRMAQRARTLAVNDRHPPESGQRRVIQIFVQFQDGVLRAEPMEFQDGGHRERLRQVRAGLGAANRLHGLACGKAPEVGRGNPKPEGPGPHLDLPAVIGSGLDDSRPVEREHENVLTDPEVPRGGSPGRGPPLGGVGFGGDAQLAQTRSSALRGLGRRMRLERGEERVQLLPAAAHQRLHLRPGAFKEPAALRFEAPRLLRNLGSLGREFRALAGNRLALARERFPFGFDRLEDLRQVGVLA